jgi:hypothetical protein
MWFVGGRYRKSPGLLENLAGCVYDGAAFGRSAIKANQDIPQGASYGE